MGICPLTRSFYGDLNEYGWGTNVKPPKTLGFKRFCWLCFHPVSGFLKIDSLRPSIIAATFTRNMPGQDCGHLLSRTVISGLFLVTTGIAFQLAGTG
jgi:hypothetical protein